MVTVPTWALGAAMGVLFVMLLPARATPARGRLALLVPALAISVTAAVARQDARTGWPALVAVGVLLAADALWARRHRR
jgi:hypothetical protein